MNAEEWRPKQQKTDVIEHSRYKGSSGESRPYGMEKRPADKRGLLIQDGQ